MLKLDFLKKLQDKTQQEIWVAEVEEKVIIRKKVKKVKNVTLPDGKLVDINSYLGTVQAMKGEKLETLSAIEDEINTL